MFGKRNNLPFSRKSDRKKEKSVVSFMHEQNIVQPNTYTGPLFVGSYLICRSRGGLSADGKKEMVASNDNLNYF